MSQSVLVGVALLAIGAFALSVGAWSSLTGRRPAWLSAKTIAADTVRLWGAGTALTGLGVAMFGVDAALLSSRVFGVTAFILMFAGAGLVVIATPRGRRR